MNQASLSHSKGRRSVCEKEIARFLKSVKLKRDWERLDLSRTETTRQRQEVEKLENGR